MTIVNGACFALPFTVNSNADFNRVSILRGLLNRLNLNACVPTPRGCVGRRDSNAGHRARLHFQSVYLDSYSFLLMRRR